MARCHRRFKEGFRAAASGTAVAAASSNAARSLHEKLFEGKMQAARALFNGVKKARAAEGERAS